MKIVFWGMESDCGITSNIMILVSYLVYHRGFRVTIVEMIEREQGIGKYFPRPHKRYRRKYIETLVERHFYYVAGKNLEIAKVIAYLEHNMDIVFVNLANRTDKEARQLMWEADLVVVNLKQEEQSFELFWTHYANLAEKLFFLIGNYIEGGICNTEYLQRKYRIPENQIAVIPYNPELEYVCEKYRIDKYIKRKNMKEPSGMRILFMREVEKTMELIYEQAKKEMAH